MDITKMSLEALKALAYDLILDSQRISNNLQAIDKQIEVLVATPKIKEEEKLAE